MNANDHSLICRACMQVAMELVHLESEIEEGGCGSYTLQDFFTFSTHLEIDKDDSLPHYLCGNCADELQRFFEFVQKARETDSALRGKLTRVKVESEADLVDEQEHDDNEEDDGTIVLTIDEQMQIEEEDEHKFDLQTNDPGGTPEPNEHNEVDIIQRVNLEDFILEEVSAEESTEREEPINHEDNEMVDSVQSTKEIEYRCSQCAKEFPSQRGLTKHLTKFHKDKFLCKICGMKFTSLNVQRMHLAKHKELSSYACQQCDKKYFTKLGLRMHMNQHHVDENPSNFLCNVCGRSFATKQRLDVHYLTHTGEKNHSCHLCEKRFATAIRLKNHLRTHNGEKPYECLTCGLKFSQSHSLKCHERIHTGEKPFECKICGKCFNQSTILKTHMTLHTGKKVKCPQCDKLFSRPSCLILHQREHTGEKPYQCHKCPNSYKQKSHLDRHMDTHLGIKHKCEICLKEYSKRSSLKIHMFSHSDDKPFQCPDCSMSFARKDKYRIHLRKLHNKVLINNEILEIREVNSEVKKENVDDGVEEQSFSEIHVIVDKD